MGIFQRFVDWFNVPDEQLIEIEAKEEKRAQWEREHPVQRVAYYLGKGTLKGIGGEIFGEAAEKALDHLKR
jgi:hypothetical protein